LEPIYIGLDHCTTTTSSSLIEKKQEGFLVVTELFMQHSSSENCYDFLLYPNHEYVLEDISFSHIVKEKNKKDG